MAEVMKFAAFKVGVYLFHGSACSDTDDNFFHGSACSDTDVNVFSRSTAPKQQ